MVNRCEHNNKLLRRRLQDIYYTCHVLYVRVASYERETQRQKKMHFRTNAPSEDSDQPAHAQADQNLHWTHFGIANVAKFLHTDNEDSNQTARMRRLSHRQAYVSEGTFSHIAA